MTNTPVLNLSSAPDVPACDHKDRFVERQPRTTAQSTSLAAFEEEEWDGVISFLGDGWSNPSHGARGGFCLDGRSKTVMTAVLTVRSGLDPHMISGNGWVDLMGWTTLKTMVKTKLVEPPVDCLWRYGVFR
ncbi:hypothetical protein EJB05_52260 [Eragrostis curvula]|uniref:Uncharacterized protein n=1 Tax=Eragrostis curvula TaxID=38414 RepID=A0A5J9STJ6_9POAL|nr:hypothetical protein EJB05_52260 [Eragrostis curvula]